ncbi:MAG: neutral zinc metallopeptidase [Polyangiales bacterium]
MKWDPGHQSPNMIDKRGQRGLGGGGMGGGLMMLLPLLLRSKWGWAILAVLAGLWLFGGLGGGGKTTDEADPNAVGGGPAQVKGEPGDQAHFVGFVLDDTQDTWRKIFSEEGKQYQDAKLVLFTNSTNTGCGYGDAATGPFYCPPDQRVYIDLGFFKDLENKLGAQGDFARAYVIAHEIGHHVQKITGINEKAAGASGPSKGATGSSVRLELQADCYAGIWAHATKQRDVLEDGDIEEAVTAATSIGDDRLQKQSTGKVQPEKWTHGSSEERVRWFKKGYDSGKMSDCDTFSASSL